MIMEGYWECPNCGRIVGSRYRSFEKYEDLVCDGCTLEVKYYEFVEI
jgi:uncharacterized protein (DUF983 family)